ncbi:MAG: hypothetical protein CVU87_10255 [Firmicutes bacterium HGW-Firmicutes-12]|jgi:hypothetical protein|nr:MAG: hypothetical protein CVU87_10255 [Firmicutes bacterium HGW-Firmicutes-12]
MQRSKSQINTTALSKKYKCDVNRIIRLWKKERNDFEVSQSLGIDAIKLLQIRQEIAYLYERERQKRLKDANIKGLGIHR